MVTAYRESTARPLPQSTGGQAFRAFGHIARQLEIEGTRLAMPEVSTIHSLINDWVEQRDAAAELLVQQLHLDSPRDVLKLEHRGRHELRETGWAYRTHGIGVDVTRTNGQGGIDFDFSTSDGELFAPPDWWRLQLFAKRSVHDKAVDSDKYASIIEDAEQHRALIEQVIATRFGI